MPGNRASELDRELLRQLWPVEARRTHAFQVELAREVYGLEPVDVLLLKACSYGLNEMEQAAACGWSYESVKKRWDIIRPALRAKTSAHAVANALREELIA